jgi:hypothetical protein
MNIMDSIPCQTPTTKRCRLRPRLEMAAHLALLIISWCPGRCKRPKNKKDGVWTSGLSHRQKYSGQAARGAALGLLIHWARNSFRAAYKVNFTLSSALSQSWNLFPWTVWRLAFHLQHHSLHICKTRIAEYYSRHQKVLHSMRFSERYTVESTKQQLRYTCVGRETA